MKTYKNFDKKYTEYAEDVVSGKIIACKLIKKACQRYLDFFDKYEFRPSKADQVVNFIGKLKHSTGSHKGKSFKLLPYQKWIVYSIFGFYKPGTNKRVTRYVYMELSRKNGKTALVAAILLYMMIADGEYGAECEMVASSREQAGICFKMCSDFIETVDPKGKIFKRLKKNISFDHTKSFMQVLSSDSTGNDGYNSYCFVLDEAHVQKDSSLWDVMTSSQGMRDNPLGIIITTAGFNLYGFCYAYRETCIEILDGVKEDDTQFIAIYTQDPDDEINDKSLWIKSNPSLGQTVKEDYLETMVRKGLNNSSELVNVMTKNMCIWCQSSEEWIPGDYIIKATTKVDLNQYKGEVAYLGVDLAAVSDLTALSVCIPRKGGKFIFKNYYFLPRTALEENSNAEFYKKLERTGELIITPSEKTDYDYVQKKIMEISEILEVYQIAYDPYFAPQFVRNCQSEGLPMKEYSQGIAHFSGPTKELEGLIRSGDVEIDNNQITRWCFSNVELKSDYSENVKPVKKIAQKKIDGVIAMIQALGIYLDEPLYLDQEIMTLKF